MIQSTDGGVLLQVRVIPRAARSQVSGTRDGALLVRLAAPPVDGAANEALIDLLAGTLGVPRRALSIVAGERDRNKRVKVAGGDVSTIRECVSRILSSNERT